MNMARACALSSLGFLIAGTTAAQADLSYRYEGNPSSGLPYLVVSGAISPTEDMDAFSAAVLANGAHVVTFDSPGGSVDKAMELGRRIRGLGLYTFQLRSAECASACSLAFLGGMYRAADPGSIGVHQSYFHPSSLLNRDDAVREVQRLTADVSAYIAEMGADPALLELSLRIDRADMRYLTGTEMARLRVTTEIPPEAEPSESEPLSAPPESEKGAALHPYKDGQTYTENFIPFTQDRNIKDALSLCGFRGGDATGMAAAISKMLSTDALKQGTVLRVGLVVQGNQPKVVRTSVYKGTEHILTIAKNDRDQFVIGNVPETNPELITAFDKPAGPHVCTAGEAPVIVATPSNERATTARLPATAPIPIPRSRWNNGLLTFFGVPMAEKPNSP